MLKRVSLVILLLVFLGVFTSAALAKTTKYPFNDVVIDGQVVEIEVGVKTTNKGDFSTCSYFSDDYAEYLGQYSDAVVAGDTAEEVLAFCVNNFDNRVE